MIVNDNNDDNKRAKMEKINPKKVAVSGCFDLLHSGHVSFFKTASTFGHVHVCIGADSTIEELKKRQTMFCEAERLYL
eukprot:Pgem_evm1s13252